MARPRIDHERRRCDRLEIRLTPAERREFDSRALLYGMTAADLVRHRVLGWRMPPKATEAQAQSLHITALVRLGNNLNQIAHHLNAGHPLADDLHGLLQRITTEMDRLLDEEN